MLKIKNTKDAEALLKRYYDGCSTTEEERELRRYFLSESADKEMETERQIFLAIAALPPTGAEERLKQNIAKWERTEQKHSFHSIAIRWSGIAACATIALFIGLSICHTEPELKDTCKTPEEAYRETQRAVLMMSECFNRSEKTVSAAEKKFSEAQEKIKNILN